MKTMTNRVLLVFNDWEDKKKSMDPLIRAGAADDAGISRLQYHHLREARHLLVGTVRPDEKPFMLLLNKQIKNLERQLYPNPLVRYIQRLKDRYIDRPAFLEQQRIQRENNMIELKRILRNSGLGSMAGRLEDHLDQDRRQIDLAVGSQLEQDKKLGLNLHFEKDPYGNFQLTQIDGKLLHGSVEVSAYTFIKSDWPEIKVGQVRGLLEGRALKQQYLDFEGRERQRWVQLGFEGIREYHPDYAFDIGRALADFHALPPDKGEIIRLLENGQQVETQWKQHGQSHEVFLQADPANKMILLFDADYRPFKPPQPEYKKEKADNSIKAEPELSNLTKGVKNGSRHKLV
ncbi:hypothetical protein MTO98_30515 [Mucilaginibacter sp. SMC90]|uniref:hypothetical protein n=1 Tax=Mucilaginibacter sp. SMC90 TaxID=2929803 RepID=UPI001FB215C7|nr:hypothetical protein [Mucilaginibacter sp. SMC90]UOE48736.1 hypothetical protein MTO98_30515 [Mucilaginibacter sp. SMC90]